MKLIEPQPATHEATQALKWLAEKDNHGLDESGLTDIVRLLISKVNELAFETQYLRNRVNNTDRLL